MIDTIYSDPNFLIHYGVKGMKWGVRHDPEPIGKAPNQINRATVRHINTKNRYTKGGMMNCSYCATSYICNSVLGMETTAKSFRPKDLAGLASKDGVTPEIFSKLFDNTTSKNFVENPKTANDLRTLSDSAKDIPNGSTGILFIQTYYGCGHYVNYEKTSSGVTTIVDTQNDIVVSAKEYETMVPGGWLGRSYVDCSNVTIANGADEYLKKMLNA